MKGDGIMSGENGMKLDDAVINIQNLRLRTYIGFNPDELEKKQDVIINVMISYGAGRACDTDEETRALDYKVITKKMIEHVEQGRFRLLEKLGADLLEIAMDSAMVTRASVTVDKPHALRFADSVSLTLSASQA